MKITDARVIKILRDFVEFHHESMDPNDKVIEFTTQEGMQAVAVEEQLVEVPATDPSIEA